MRSDSWIGRLWDAESQISRTLSVVDSSLSCSESTCTCSSYSYLVCGGEVTALEALGRFGAKVTFSTATCLLKCGPEGVLCRFGLPKLAVAPCSSATILD